MTIINSILAEHRQITDAMYRLHDAIVRHNTATLEPYSTDLSNMFEDINQKGDVAERNTISRLGSSGDLPRVSEELYNPSSDIFDSNSVRSIILPPDSESIFATGSSSGSDEISCTSVYLIKHDYKVWAEIKNYHTLQIIKYSVTSLPYPVLYQDSLNSHGFLFGGRLGGPYTTESLDIVGNLHSITYPFSVIYSTYDDGIESMNSSGELFDIFYPSEVIYGDYTYTESMDSIGSLYEMSFPFEGAYIEYDTVPEELNSTGQLHALFFS